MKILLVEDEASARHLLTSFLSPHGACDIAESGEIGLEQFKTALESGAPYDLACLDIKLPGMDGLETLRMIREEEEARGIFPGQGTKVIMTTAVDDKAKIIKAFNEQCEVYLTKPISKSRLDEKLTELGLV
jgi:two-component system, chemotaxis family, chemotaxis protein CheY